ncbi:MAG: UDP-N-acetylmuramate dehydrogenase [Clostridia bacterium]|nr:UDP-N-acetylmuramate dehydrogenase [Clostridia bacterium]
MLKDYLVKESSFNRLTFQTDARLAPHTTFGIGGLADYLVTPHNEEAFLSLVTLLRENEIRFGVFGNGSNLLFDDKGFRGVVILTKGIRGVEFQDTLVKVSCGVPLISLSIQAARHSLSGLEFACGIPGTVGGAIFMNAGAHGGAMSDIVLSSRYLDVQGNVLEITQHDFAYRHSVYQDTDRIILSCCLGLSYGTESEIRAKMEENKQKRTMTQPVNDKSAGSVFRRTEGVIPAALIDRAGLKGLSVCGASVSEKHAGFIVNRGDATACDVLSLIELIKNRIDSVYGVQLIPEIRYIPER